MVPEPSNEGETRGPGYARRVPDPSLASHGLPTRSIRSVPQLWRTADPIRPRRQHGLLAHGSTSTGAAADGASEYPPSDVRSLLLLIGFGKKRHLSPLLLTLNDKVQYYDFIDLYKVYMHIVKIL